MLIHIYILNGTAFIENTHAQSSHTIQNSISLAYFNESLPHYTLLLLIQAFSLRSTAINNLPVYYLWTIGLSTFQKLSLMTTTRGNICIIVDINTWQT